MGRTDVASGRRPSSGAGRFGNALHPDEIQVAQVGSPESATGYKQPPPQEKGFAASTAAAAGMTKQAINQHLARAEALGDDLERIKGKDQPATLPLDPLAARHY